MPDPFIFEHGEFSLSITYDHRDEFLAGYPLLPQAIDAAVNHLAGFIRFGGTIDIVVQVTDTASGRLSAGPADLFVTGETFGGQRVLALSLLEESATGIDRNPDLPDIVIHIPHSAGYLDQHWFDPDSDAAIPATMIDLQSVLIHELFHGLGIAGYRDNVTGEFTRGDATVFDTLVNVENNQAFFAGTAVTALLGEPLELALGRQEGIYHLGGGDVADESAQGWLLADNLNSYSYQRGERYEIGQLDLAILSDLGWQLKGAPPADVTNLWDMQVNARYLVGSASGDMLEGGFRADRIEGRGGDDILAGLAGDDRLDGGEGFDTAVFGGVRADYAIFRADGGGLVVSDRRGGDASDGSDTVLGIELLRFADGDFTPSALLGERSADTASGWYIHAGAGFVGEVAGTGYVFGTSALQDVTVADAAGTITFDPSFNRGGDVIRLPGDAADWQVVRSGSSAWLSDGDTSVLIPIGTESATLDFADGTRALFFNAASGQAMIGSQAITGTFAALDSGQQQSSAIPSAPVFAPSAVSMVPHAPLGDVPAIEWHALSGMAFPG